MNDYFVYEFDMRSNSVEFNTVTTGITEIQTRFYI
jgi:hypothetical protein